jgi:hypothetical protein
MEKHAIVIHSDTGDATEKHGVAVPELRLAQADP